MADTATPVRCCFGFEMQKLGKNSRGDETPPANSGKKSASLMQNI
jgi:hypothetical protein